MSGKQSWFYKLSLAAVIFGMVVISAVLIDGEPAKPRHVGVVDDWSFHHLVFSNPGTEAQAVANGTYSKWLKLQYDTRFIIQKLRRSTAVKPLADAGTADVNPLAGPEAARVKAPPKPPPKAPPKAPVKKASINKDWSENLLTGQVQPNMYPALYGASPTKASCSGDFIAFPTGSAGAANAASIVAYYELYSSCAGSPTVYWAYNTNGGTISNSPISYTDGQLAFIQVTGTTASLVLLKGAKASTSPTVTTPTQLTTSNRTVTGCNPSTTSTTLICNTGSFTSADVGTAISDGTHILLGTTITGYTSGTTVMLSQDPATNGTSVSETVSDFTSTVVSPANYSSCTPPCMTSMFLHGSPGDTYSAPFYDFTNDDLYVGDDSGKLHQFTGVFLGTPTENTTSPWPVTLSDELTSPVYDPTSGYVFVGNTGGILYAVGTGNEGTSSGNVHGQSNSLGNVIMDAPLLDPNAEMLYVFVTRNSAGNNAVFQFNTSFTTGYGNGSPTGTEVGSAGTAIDDYYLYAGDFDNVYFESPSSTSPSGNLYIIGGTGATTGATLYQIPITSNVMNEYANSAVTGLNTGEEPWPSPLTEFCNNGASPCGLNAGGTATTSGIDYLFFSLNSSSMGGCSGSSGNGCLLAYNISTPTAVTLSGTGFVLTAQTNPGCWVTSGIVIDNSDTTTAGASQVYFMNLNGNSPGGPTTGNYTSTGCTHNSDANIIAAVQAEQFSPSGTNPTPSLTSLAPYKAYAGASQQTLAIFGTNFLPNSTVTYNGAARTPTLVSTNELTITLSAADQATAGSYPVMVTNPGGGASNTLDFTVASAASLSVSLSPNTGLNFGSQYFLVTSAAQTVNLNNTGSETLNITSIAVTGTNASNFAQTNNCGSSLLAGDSCTISVTFSPTTTGAEAATVSITDSAAGSPQTVTLNGTGTVSGKQFMTLDSTKKYLVNTFTDKPVFMTGDSPQIITEELDNADAATYLQDRATRGFNALWMIVTDQYDQANPPEDFYGNAPFSGAWFSATEVSAYWAHVDAIVQEAASLGMTVFFMPSFIGSSDESYDLNAMLSNTDATISAYGTFIGNRYKNYNNIVYVLGGDTDPTTTGLATKINDLGSAIAAADSNHLITMEGCRYTCNSGEEKNTVQSYGGSPPAWIGLNWTYSGAPDVVTSCRQSYTSSPFFPPFMGEDFYELDSRVTPVQVRQEGYWEVLSGCYLGRLFGNDDIWTFNSPTYGTPSSTWQSQLGSVGSVGEEYLGLLMRSREHWLMVPDTSNAVLTGGIGSGTSISVAACTSDGQTCIVYDPIGNSQAPQINMAHFSGTVHAWWFNPSTAVTTDLGTFQNSETTTFTPPDSNDWVLVLDLSSAGLAAPGSVPL
jgi:hypothetical protein